MKKYMLMLPLKGSMFGITTQQLIKHLHSHKCGHEVVLMPDDTSVIYATAPSIEIISEMCTSNELPGLVIEYTGIYDQVIEEEVL